MLRPSAWAWPPVAWTGPRVRVPALSEAQVVFVACLGVYLALASYLVFGLGLVIGDAWSRVGNAAYVLLSRDPHLAAIGFVWNPLPSLLVLPFIPLARVWPALLQEGFAANLISAAAMALAIVELRGLLVELGIRRPLRLTLIGATALHPLIAYYAANGMSEALFLLTLMFTVRRLAAWIHSGAVATLALTGLGLGVAYLVRYEAAAAAIAVTAAVVLVSARRAAPDLRRSDALADAIVVAAPFCATFSVWALTSWLIVGSPFATFTSVYGNSSQVALMVPWIQLATGQGTALAPIYALRQVLGLAPGLVLAPAIGLLALRARDRSVLAVAPLAGIVLFAAFVFVTGHSFGWLRFSIAAVPLAVVLAAISAPILRRAGVPRALGAAIVAACVWAGVPAGTATMLDRSLGQEEARQLVPYLANAFGGPGGIPPESESYRLGGEVARAIDALDLPRGSVLVDVAAGFPVVLHSEHTEQFVITTDRDFERTLSAPALFGVRYLLVPDDTYLGTLDAINRRYPGIYASGAGIGVLVQEFRSRSFSWRLYSVLEE